MLHTLWKQKGAVGRTAAALWILTVASIAAASPATHGRVRPLNRVYKTHQGWEYRTDHFITFATTSADDARWAGEELEAAWRETARLADHFGDTHRRQDFGLVGSLITSTSEAPRNTGNRYPRLAPPLDPAVVQVELGTSSDEKADARRALRKGAAATLLRQAGYLGKLPQWVAEGLIQFVSDETWNEEQFAAAQATSSNRGGAATAWELVFRYMMTADDAALSATFLASYGDDADFRLRRKVPVHSRWDRVTAESAMADQQRAPSPFAPGMNEAELRAKVEKWLLDPHSNEPLIVGTMADDSPDAQRGRDMALLVKLWDRFLATQAGAEATAENVATADGRAHDDPPQADGRAAGAAAKIDLDRLYRALTSDGGPAWSTIDSDGRVLTWRDRDRLDELFADRTLGYRSIVRDGQAVLQWPEGDGSVLEAWLQRDPQQSQRPTIHVQNVRASATF